MTTIAIMNRSSVVKDADLKPAVAALQKQVDHDLQPVWGVRADLLFVARKDQAPAQAWQLGVFDTSDQANALGYHDVTAAGQPLGKAFAKSDIDNGYAWTITLSHELIEMLGDPEINLCAQDGKKLWAYELCDPCESDEFGYAIDGVKLSDFVTPNWFKPTTGVKGPFDFKAHIKKPLGLLKGGYAQFLEIGGGTGWQQVTADKGRALAQNRPRPGSRRERRRVDREGWEVSTEKG